MDLQELLKDIDFDAIIQFLEQEDTDEVVEKERGAFNRKVREVLKRKLMMPKEETSQDFSAVAAISGTITHQGIKAAMHNLLESIKFNTWVYDYLEPAHLNSIRTFCESDKLLRVHHKQVGANLFRGQIRDYEVLSTLVENRVTTYNSNKELCYFLRCLICIYQLRTNIHHNAEVSPAVRQLCVNTRDIIKAKAPEIGFFHQETPLLTLDRLINAAKLKVHPLNSSMKGLNLLRESIGKTPEAGEKKQEKNDSSKAPTNSPQKLRNYGRNYEYGSFFREIRSFDTDKTEPNQQTLLSLSTEEQTNISRQGRMARLHSAKFRNEQENQYLPLDWKALSKLEIRIALAYVSNTENLLPIEQLVFFLTLFMCVNPSEIQNTSITEDRFSHTGNLQLCIAKKTWTHSYPEIESRFSPTDRQAEILAPNTSNVTLPIPNILYDFLLDYDESIPSLLASLKGQNVSKLVQTTCSKVSSGTAARITPLKLRAALFFLGMRKTADPMLTSHAIANNEFSPSVEDYYYSADCSTVEKTYRNICSEIGASTPESSNNVTEVRAGSKLYYPPSRHRVTLEKLINKLSLAKYQAENGSLNEVINFHNLFTCYTAWLIWCGAGFRPRKFIPINSHNVDGDWVLIDEKSKPYNNIRLVRLPPICKRQLEAYIKHLKSLSIFLRKNNHSIYKKISCLDLPAFQLNEISLFFELNNSAEVSVSPLRSRTVLQRVGIPETLQENLARHWYDSGPRNYGVPAEWIAAATGHIGAGQRAWSISSTFSPLHKEYLKRWDAGLTKWIEELGFKPVTGFETSGQFRRSSIKDANCTLFKRNAVICTKYNVKKIVKEAIQAAISESDSGNIRHDKAIQDVAIKIIHDKCTESSLQLEKAHNLFLRYLEFNAKTNRSKLPFSYYRNGEPEPSRFQQNDLILLNRSRKIRSFLLRQIEKDYAIASDEDKLAYTALSLIFLDGIVSKNVLSILLINLKEHTYNRENAYWLEWEEHNRLKRRILSFESTLLISALDLSKKVTWSMITKAVANALCRPVLRNVLAGYTKKDLHLDKMLELATVWTKFHLPGNLNAYANGELKCASTPASNFVSLLSGIPHIAMDTLTRDGDKLVTVVLPRNDAEKTSIEALKNELSKVTNLIKEPLPASAKTIDDGKPSPARKELHHEAGLIVNEWIQNKLPSKLIAIGLYTQILILEKSHTSFYAAKTIADYVRSVGIPMLEAQNDLDFFVAESDDLEDFYLDILDYDQTFKSRTRRAKRIVYFHNFCVKNLGLPAIDFGGLDPAFFAASNTGVHARVLTYASYQKALELLKSANQKDPEIATLSLVLILMFRFKLRLSEALARTTKDLMFDAPYIRLWVRTNRIGKLKSQAARRQVLNWYLDEHELTVINNRLNFFNARFNKEECALFACTDDPWRLVSRTSLSKRLLALLKSISGDTTFRGHHARHTNASTITNYLTSKNQPAGIQSNRSFQPSPV